MAIPVALEHLAGIQPALCRQELAHARMCGEQLVAPRKAMVGQEITAAVAQRVIDEPPEMICGALDVRRAMIDVQVEDDAGPVFARPGQRGFAVPPR